MISFRCPCGERLTVAAKHAGTVVMCPTCQGRVTASAGGWSDRSSGGRLSYKRRVALQARFDFARHTRMAGIALGVLMLATMVIPLPADGGQMQMPYQWRAIRTTPGMLVLVLGTWSAGALAIVAAMLPPGLKRSVAFLVAASMALGMPIAAMLAAPNGVKLLGELVSQFRKLGNLQALGAWVSILALLSLGHARLQIGGGPAVRICQGVFAAVLVVVFGLLTIKAFDQAQAAAKASPAVAIVMISGLSITIQPWIWIAATLLGCVSLLVGGLAALANACRAKMSRGLAATSLLLIYVPLGMAVVLAIGIPFRAIGGNGLAVGSLACFLVLPRFLLGSLAGATLIAACVRARLDRSEHRLEIVN